MDTKVMINAILIIVAVGLAVGGQLAMKAGMNDVGDITLDRFGSPFVLLREVAGSFWVVLGLLMYVISAVFWLVVLSRVPLSVAYPMVAAGYVVVVFFSWKLFNESVRWFSWMGLTVIVIGVVITSFGLKAPK